jgi:hypothetical protein
MGTIHKVKTYKTENIVGLFQTNTSIAINELQAQLKARNKEIM